MMADKHALVEPSNVERPSTEVIVPGNLQLDYQLTIEDVKRELGCDFPIHYLLYTKNFVKLVDYFKRGAFSPDDLNQRDARGNTPILLAAKLSPKDDEYLKAVNYLFEKGANGKLRDTSGWSVMDEAISQQNTRLLAIAFD